MKTRNKKGDLQGGPHQSGHPAVPRRETSARVWASFGSWLRTVRPGIPPSELVTATATHNALPEFFAGADSSPIFKKFLRDRLDPHSYEPLRLAG